MAGASPSGSWPQARHQRHVDWYCVPHARHVGRSVSAIARKGTLRGVEPTSAPDAPNATLYDLVGGDGWFAALVDRFYAGVETDGPLRALYPADLTGSRAHMTGFLIQYWGGPGTYSETRGHPRLRMRHAPFDIGDTEREAWLRHMIVAVQAGGLSEQVEVQVIEYFEMASRHLINRT